MNCNEAIVLVPAYGDGELDAVQSLAVEKHLLACADCAARHANFIELRKQIRAGVPYFAATSELKSRIEAMAAQVPATAAFGQNNDFDAPFLNIEDRIGSVSLAKDNVTL